jgi:hypothetical protein
MAEEYAMLGGVEEDTMDETADRCSFSSSMPKISTLSDKDEPEAIRYRSP